MRRYAAPVAFLAAVTVAVLLVRLELHHGSPHHPSQASSVILNLTSSPPVKRTHHRHHRHVRTYTVQSGDTFGSIAQKNGTTVARLEQFNPGVDPTALQVGQKIRVQ